MTQETKQCPLCAEEIKLAAVLCKHCGNEIDEPVLSQSVFEHSFELGRCVHCGVSSTNAMRYKTQCKAATHNEPIASTTTPSHSAIASDSATPLSCPKCKTTQFTAQKQGFGLGKAAVGGVLTGGVGLLAGFIGSGKVKITCLKCGHTWKPKR